jgi:hypothetical protein
VAQIARIIAEEVPRAAVAAPADGVAVTAAD